jgi:hypothetical protein
MVDPVPPHAARHDGLIDQLSGSLQPVRRPLPAWMRAAGWMVLALPCGLAATRIIPNYTPDWGQPGMGWAMAEIALSLCVGAMAVVLAFGISIAGRPARGRRLVVALGLVWLMVCLGNIASSPAWVPHFGAGAHCYSFMMLASAPMMPMVILALRRTRALRPGRTLVMAGVGIAFLVSGLLGFCHQGTLHAVDFLMHLVAGGCIVALTTLLGRRFIAV